MIEEQWKPIKDYEGRYEISNFGRVKSLPKKWESGHNTIREKQETLLKQNSNSTGYYSISLYKNSNHSVRTVHQLVWDYFGDGERDGIKLQIDHIDNNKLNNRIDNLQLLTTRQNVSKGCGTRKSTSVYIGVNWNKGAKMWRAVIHINGDNRHLGYFKTEYSAHVEYERALKEFRKTGEITTYTHIPTSRYRHVYFRKRNSKWEGNVPVNGKRKFAGSFENEIDAHKACEAMKVKYA